ncbi:MAG: hypothetical protein IID46_15825 [Planctomycetes bacterium]|nr:hypothetical protein [Planctomycetota bacterium]
MSDPFLPIGNLRGRCLLFAVHTTGSTGAVLDDSPAMFRIGNVASQFAARVSLIAFAMATLRGAIIGANFDDAMNSALFAALVFFGLGLIVGELARRTVEEIAQTEFEKLIADQQPVLETADDGSSTGKRAEDSPVRTSEI